MEIKLNTLTQEQRKALEAIENAIKSKKSELFFIEGPAGSGKTYLLKYLCQNYRTLPISFTSLAARSFENGRTSHSLLQDGLYEVKSLDNVQIVTFDTANMMDNDHLQKLDEKLQNLTGKTSKFGGKLVVFAGDFNQVESIGYADWPMKMVNKFCLSRNMRAKSDPAFSTLLQQVDRNVLDAEELKEAHTMLFTSNFSKILDIYNKNPGQDVAVLFATKEQCDNFNNKMVERLGKDEGVILTNVDQREMRLKIGTVCIFIGNKPLENIFLNGTRFVIVNIKKEGISGELLNGPNRGDIVQIHPNDFGTYPFDISFGMTIHKVCGWEFDKIGLFIDTSKLLWDNAMLYTALSRVRTSNDVLIYDLAD